MSTMRKAHPIRNLLVLASAGLLVGSLLYFVPEADAGRRGRGSVRHSSKSGGSRAQPSRGSTRRGGSAQPSRGSRRGGSAQPSRGGSGARRGSYGGRGRGGRADARYSARKDARRDYRRYRAVTGLIRTGVYLATRPRYSTTVVVIGTTYYYAGGVYYAQRGSRYVVVVPPRGAVVYGVPTATTVVYVDHQPYYYYGGTYYIVSDKPAEKPDVSDMNVNVNVTVTTEDGEEAELPPVPLDDEQNYEVVGPPVGVTVPYLPESAHEETVGGKAYFVHEGTYYRPFASDGETIYQVVEDPNQAG